VTELPSDASTVIVRIPQPKTNVNWYELVKSTPPWAKKLEKEMGIGKTQVGYPSVCCESDLNVPNITAQNYLGMRYFTEVGILYLKMSKRNRTLI
jgi:hypothetical protein